MPISQAQKGWRNSKPGVWGRIDRSVSFAPKDICCLFNEGAGATCYNKASKNANGTIAGTVARAAGRGQKAISLNRTGTSGKVSFPNITFSTTCWFAFWIYPMSNPGSYCQLFGDAAGTTASLYYRGSLNKFDITFGAADHNNNTAVSINQWHHFAVSITGGSGTFYLDGKPDGTFTGYPGTTFNQIGNDNFTEYFVGQIESLIGSKSESLTAAEIKALYNDRYSFMVAEPPGGPAPKVFSGSGSAVIQDLTAAGAGTYTAPVYAGDGAALIGDMSAAGAGLYTPPNYAGTGTATFGPFTGAGVGVYGPPWSSATLIDSALIEDASDISGIDPTKSKITPI